MNRVVLDWRKFNSFVDAQNALRTKVPFEGREVPWCFPCVYLLTDVLEQVVLRVGHSQNILEEYKGSRYVVEAALYQSGKHVFIARAPIDEEERKVVEATLIKM